MMSTLKIHQIVLLFFLFIISFFTFSPSINSGFSRLDDHLMVHFNAQTKKLNLQNITASFTSEYRKLYHPVVTISYMLERHFFGLIPEFFHVNNILLHTFICLLVFFIFMELTDSFAVSYIVSLLFAIHPVHVEVAAWISARKDLLYSFFYLSALLMYIKAHKSRHSSVLLCLSLLFFILSCLSKAMAVTLPFILILTDYYLGTISKKRIKTYCIFSFISFIFVFVAIHAHYSDNADAPFVLFNLMINYINAHFHILFYIYKFILPTKLYCMYPGFYPQASLPPFYILYSPCILYFLTLLVFLTLKYSKKIFFGFIFFFITLLPSSGILPIGIAPVADRYVYLPYIGLFYIFAEFSIFLYKKANVYLRLILIIIFIFLSSELIYLSYLRCLDWKNNTFGVPDKRNYEIMKIYYNKNISAHPVKNGKVLLYCD